MLHPFSGIMTISETTLKDILLMLAKEQNEKSSVLGRRIERLMVDPASNSLLFAERARKLISVQRVTAVFGCWTSVSRNPVPPMFE